LKARAGASLLGIVFLMWVWSHRNRFHPDTV
jgi:hypothetical protein